MEKLYRFLFNDWGDSFDPDFNFEELEKIFPDRTEIHAEYREKKYYNFDTIKVVGKKHRTWEADYLDKPLLLTDYEFEVYSGRDTEYHSKGEYVGKNGDTFEDDEDPDWEIGCELETAIYRGHSVYKPLGSNMDKETEVLTRGGTVVTAPLSAIIDFMKSRKGAYLTIRNEGNEDLKRYYDFVIGVCTSIEY